MKRACSIVVLVLLFAVPGLAFAEPFTTPHRIVFGLGHHLFWPEGDEEEGTRPDEDGIVTDDEWLYIFDQGYDISDYNGATLEVGYEYLFMHWFGLGFNLGYYGGTQSYDFKIEGISLATDITVGVLHLDIMPRFHWQTRWTDLFGGPVLGMYNANVRGDFTASYQDYEFSEDETDQDTALGWGLDLGFEFRISEHWGIALEDRVTSAVMFQDKKRTEWFNGAGNVLLLSGVLHL